MQRSEHNDIDRLFQIHFEGHEVAVADRDALWQRIMPARKRRGFGFLFLFGALFLGGTSFSFFMFQDNLTGREQSVVSDDVTLEAQLEKLIAKSDVSDKSHDIDHSTNATSKIEITTSSSHTSPFVERLQEKSAAIVIAEVEEIRGKVVEINNATTFERDNHNQSGLVSLIQEANDEIATTDPPFTSNDMISLDAQRQLNALTQELMALDEQLIFRLNLPALSIPTPSFYKDNNPLDDCIVGGRDGQFYIDLYTALAKPIDQVTLNAGQEDQVLFLEAWKERYNSISTISGGIAVGYEFKSGLDVAVGIEYERLESQYTTTRTITERVTVYDPEAFFFFDDDGQIVYVGDSVTAVSTFDRTTSAANTTTMLQVPVQLSYPIHRRGAWDIKALVSAAMNLSVQYRGRHLRPDLSVVQIDPTNESTYLSPNVGLSLEAGAHIGHLLGEHWEVYLSPRFRMNQQSYLLDTEMINLSRSFLRLRGGLRYRF